MPTATNTIRRRLKYALRDAVRAIGLSEFLPADIVVRRHPVARDLAGNCIVISGDSIRRRPSPAGLRIRVFVYTITVFILGDGGSEPDQDKQLDILESIDAIFDLPPTMPAAITSAVPETCEMRSENSRQFLNEAVKYGVDKHTTMVAIEVCQVAGVAA